MKRLIALLFACLPVLGMADTTADTPTLSPTSVAACVKTASAAAETQGKSLTAFACSVTATVDIVYQAPVTAGYTKCAAENGICDPKGPADVIFGAQRSYSAPKHFAVATPCTNAVFGDPDFGVVKSCWYKPSATVTAWVLNTREGNPFGIAGQARFGLGGTWSTTVAVKAGDVCTPELFGMPHSGWNQGRFCEIQTTVPAVTQGPPGSMVVVNTGLIPPKIYGSTTADVRTLTADERLPGSPFLALPTDVGAFRDPCAYSSIQNIDPILFPGKVGAGHFHMLAGNDGANENSTYDTLMKSGGSTCAGGILNRTAYWMPLIVKKTTGQPVIPTGSVQYYKLGYNGVKPAQVKGFPPGLKMLSSYGRFYCDGGPDANVWMDHIPLNCPAGAELVAGIGFPQCWDGVNLDSADHRAHMHDAQAPNGCPATHPVALAEHSQNWHYPVEEGGTADWVLSSDMSATLPPGYSIHADWFGAWDPVTMQKFVTNCIVNSLDCHAYLLGLDETLF